MESETDRLAKAFGEGCDARLRGDPPDVRDYHGSDRMIRELRNSWDRGYHHVDHYWGIDAKWQVPRLPPVRKAVPA